MNASQTTNQTTSPAASVRKTEPSEAAVPEKIAAATLKPDTVKLSPAAQVRLLHRQGLSIAGIAASLGTNVTTIDSYLNVTAPKATANAPVAADTDGDKAEAGKTISAPKSSSPVAAAQEAAPKVAEVAAKG